MRVCGGEAVRAVKGLGWFGWALAGVAAFIGIAVFTFGGLLGVFGFCSTGRMSFYRPPEIMVNDRVYATTEYSADFVFYRGDFKVIGQVREAVGDREMLTENFQAYGIEEGTKIYYDNQIPYMVYAERNLWYTRLVTEEMHGAFLYHNSMVYVALIRLDYDECQRFYRPIYGDEDLVSEIPEDAIYLGETRFVGYNMRVERELESSHFYRPQAIYQDRHNPGKLYAGDGMVYVLRLK